MGGLVTIILAGTIGALALLGGATVTVSTCRLISGDWLLMVSEAVSIIAAVLVSMLLRQITINQDTKHLRLPGVPDSDAVAIMLV